MPSASDYQVHSVTYLPDQPTVTITVTPMAGPFAGKLNDLYCTQEELNERRANVNAPWGDAEVYAEAAFQLDAMAIRLLDAQGNEVEVPAE